MIVRLTGILADVNEDSVVIERDGLAREVLAPACSIPEFAALRGREVTLHTFELIEGNAQSGNLAPILIGFPSAEDRRFFKRFISVKGIGVRKALKALSEPLPRIAAWIQEADVKALAKLKGIGPRGAQQIVVDLRDKVAEFALSAGAAAAEVTARFTAAQRDALALMVSWGDARADAERWLHDAMQKHPDTDTAEEWVRAAYRIRSGTE